MIYLIDIFVLNFNHFNKDRLWYCCVRPWLLSGICSPVLLPLTSSISFHCSTQSKAKVLNFNNYFEEFSSFFSQLKLVLVHRNRVIIYWEFISDEHELLVIPLLCILMFQTHLMNSWSSQAKLVVNQAASRVSLWVSFKIARSATRCEQFYIINLFIF